MDWDEHGIQRRVAGKHSFRLDGIADLLPRVVGCSVLDLGCNRGAVALQMAWAGASVVHGVDNYELGIQNARELFADERSVKSKFEVADLTKPEAIQNAFGDERYDIVLMLATYHKLKRLMAADALTSLTRNLGRRTNRYFAWRATSFKRAENEEEMGNLDRDLGHEGLKRIHTSYISRELGVAAIWGRE